MVVLRFFSVLSFFPWFLRHIILYYCLFSSFALWSHLFCLRCLYHIFLTLCHIRIPIYLVSFHFVFAHLFTFYYHLPATSPVFMPLYYIFLSLNYLGNHLFMLCSFEISFISNVDHHAAEWWKRKSSQINLHLLTASMYNHAKNLSRGDCWWC